MLEESFAVQTSLHDGPTIQRVEIEVRELQMQYDIVRRTMQTVVLAQWFARLEQENASKE